MHNYDAGMKRPRMEGPPGGYGGGPPPGGYGGGPPPYGMGPPGMMEGPPGHGYMGGPDYGMGGPGMMGGAGGAGFPCVKLRGLPFDVSEEDIRMFLGLEPIDVVLVKRDGRLTGEAFVVLGNAMHIDMALQKNRSYMGRRYIEIFRAKKMDYYRAVATEVAEGGGGGGGFAGREGRPPYSGRDESRFAGPPGTEGYEGGGYGGRGAGAAGNAAGGEGSAGTTILKLRGLPFQVTDDDICSWFNSDTSLGISPVVKDNVLVVMDNGRPSGIAFVEFPSPQEATQAMAKNKQMIGTRYIEIFPANRADLDRCR